MTVTTNMTYPVTDFIHFLKNQRLKCQNQNQHEIIQGEHPAGARCLGSNGQTTMAAHTKPVRQFSAGLGTGQYGQSLNQG